MRVERYQSEHFGQVEKLIREHNSIARRDLDPTFSFDALQSKLADKDAVTFCCFQDDELISFFISHKFESMPTWYVRLVCAKKTAFFNPVRVGICELYNHTISYWEEQGLENFIYVQPAIYLTAGNPRIRSGSAKLQEYKPFNYYTVKAGTQSDQLLIRRLVNDIVFEEDMIVRWCFKNEK